jgi:hypothetical protein
MARVKKTRAWAIVTRNTERLAKHVGWDELCIYKTRRLARENRGDSIIYKVIPVSIVVKGRGRK